MSDCQFCPVERECFYPYKPTECAQQRKFWSEQEAKDRGETKQPTGEESK